MGFASYNDQVCLEKRNKGQHKEACQLHDRQAHSSSSLWHAFSQPILQVTSHCHLGKVMWDIQNRSDEESQKAHTHLSQ